MNFQELLMKITIEEIDYFYDAAGNRTLKKICDDNGDTDVNYTYDLNNRLLEESTNYYSKNEIDVTKYVYDNNGNQIKKIGYTTKGGKWLTKSGFSFRK